MGKYYKDLYSWGSLANKDFVTPDLFNSGYQEDGSPGVQQASLNLVGDADGNNFFLLSGFSVVNDIGNDYNIGTGVSFLSGQIQYYEGEHSKPMGMIAGYIYLKHDGNIVVSADMDVNGCLIAEFDDEVPTDLRNRRIEKDGLWVDYNSEHQYFHGQVEIDKTLTMNKTGFVAGDWNVTGELNVDGYTTIDDEVYVSSNLHIGGTGQIDGSRLHVAGDLIVSGVIGLTDASTITHLNSQITFNTNSLQFSGLSVTGMADTKFEDPVHMASSLNVTGESILNAVLMGTADKIRWIDDDQYISAVAGTMTIDGEDNVDILAATQIDITSPITVVSEILTVNTSLNVPSITGDVTYNGDTLSLKNSNSSIEVNKTLSASLRYNGITINMSNDGDNTTNFGKPIKVGGTYSNGSESGDVIGLCVSDSKVLVFGTIRNDGWGSLVPGDPVYLGNTIGSLVQDASATFVTPIGIAITSTYIFVSPSFVVVE